MQIHQELVGVDVVERHQSCRDDSRQNINEKWPIREHPQSRQAKGIGDSRASGFTRRCTGGVCGNSKHKIARTTDPIAANRKQSGEMAGAAKPMNNPAAIQPSVPRRGTGRIAEPDRASCERRQHWRDDGRNVDAGVSEHEGEERREGTPGRRPYGGS